MSFLDNGKKIAALEKEVAEVTANFGTMSALAESRLADLNALTEKLSALEKSSAEALAKSTAQTVAADAALAAEKVAHEATKVSVDAQAAIKAQTILAQAGQPPVKGGAEQTKSKQEIVDEFNSMSPGAARSAFFAKHKKHLI